MADLISTAEAARLLNRDQSTVSRWAASGRLKPAYRAPGIRGPNVFEKADVEALAAELAKAEQDAS